MQNSPESPRPVTLPSFAFWWMMFAVCGGLGWGSPLLFISGLVVPALLLAVWFLAQI